MPETTAIEGKPLVEWPWAADCYDMDGIGSIGILASVAAQPLNIATAIPQVSADSSADSSAGTGGAPSAAVAADYSMSVLAKVTHAGADQALALIQMLAPTK